MPCIHRSSTICGITGFRQARGCQKRDRHRFTDRQKADTRKIQLHQRTQLGGIYDQKDKTIDENRVVFK